MKHVIKFPTVRQYSLRGDHIATYTSRKAIEKEGFNVTRVLSCCDGRILRSQGYVWKYYKEFPTYAKKINNNHSAVSRPVYCCEWGTDIVVRQYPSITSAARLLGGCESGIWSCLAGYKKGYKGYSWRYVDGKPVNHRSRVRKNEGEGGEKCQDPH